MAANGIHELMLAVGARNGASSGAAGALQRGGRYGVLHGDTAPPALTVQAVENGDTAQPNSAARTALSRLNLYKCQV